MSSKRIGTVIYLGSIKKQSSLTIDKLVKSPF